MATTLSLPSIFTGHHQLPEHCAPTSQYLIRVSSAFGSCVPTSLAFLSTALGIFSIISWLFGQVPQMYKNYKLQSASGLSIYFLTEWLFGDLTNLLGALLTKQATWQVVVASYYVTVDVGLCYQYFWYTHVKAWRKIRMVDYESDTDHSHEGSDDVLIGVSPSGGSSQSNSTRYKGGEDEMKAAKQSTKPRDVPEPPQNHNLSYHKEKGTPSSSRSISRANQPPSLIPSPQALILVSMLCAVLTNASPLHKQATDSSQAISSSEFAGRILSWISTLLYLGSRLPQIYKNAIRRSTSGLSPTLFIAAFCGNFFYSTSLLTNPLAWGSYPPYGLHGWAGPEGSDRKTWVALAAPFWLGAAGVLTMDATIGLQFLIYKERGEEILVEDREGRSSWRKVTGWMRGWAPSPGPSARVEEEVVEDSRLLRERRESGERGYGTA